jgi:2',3'-cyclic-nucleotide 2'-phosphodiesterase (5'-nucleotidase family)
MSEIMKAVRETMTFAQAPQMNAAEILKRIENSHNSSLKLTKDNLMDALNYYKNLSVIYLDENETVFFL